MSSKSENDFESAADLTEQFELEEEDLGAERDMEFWSDADIVIEDGRARMIVYVDTDVYEWFTARGDDYHSHINEVLRRYIDFVQKNK